MQRLKMKIVHLTITITIIISIFFFSDSISQSSAALLTPITKDPSTNLYSIQAYFKSHLQLTKLFLDLGASLSWIDCSNYKSSTSHHVLYNSTLCTQLDTFVWGNCFKRPSPSCSTDSCEFFSENVVTGHISLGEIVTDTFALPTTNGINQGPLAVFSDDFVFACAGDTDLLKGLPKGVRGLGALGRYNFSLSAQVSRAFSSPFVFAICLPSTPSSNGVAVFNSRGPYSFLPGIDLSSSLIYTPLILNPIYSTIEYYPNRPSDEFFVNVTAIKVNGNAVPLNHTLLTINQEDGTGGTKITTSRAYSVLETSIYNAVTAAFKKGSAALKYKLTTPVKPFTTCYSALNVPSTRVGPAFPTVDLVLQNDGVVWRIFGANLMVGVKSDDGKDAWCLGFLDGGFSPRTSIVIGGHQLEDNLLQFDLVNQRLGFSSSVLLHSTTCANFNFTATTTTTD